MRMNLINNIINGPRIGIGPFEIYEAAKIGREALLNLIGQGVNVNSQDGYGRTALFYAADEGSKNAIKTLLDDTNANINHKDADGKTALFFAVDANAREDVIEDIINFFLEKGASIETFTRDANGNDIKLSSALCEAAFFNKASLVRKFINFGADINWIDHFFQSSALSIAFWQENKDQENKDIIKDLLDGGANIDLVPEKKKQILLSHAASHGSEEILELILPRVDYTSTNDIEGNTLIHWATCSGKTNIIDICLKYGANINDTNNAKETALHWAAEDGHANIIEHLINKGINVNHANKDGYTALHLAALGGKKEVVSILLRKNADQNIANDEGKTALQLAKEQGFSEIVNLLRPKVTTTDFEKTLKEFEAKIQKSEEQLRKITDNFLTLTLEEKIQKILGNNKKPEDEKEDFSENSTTNKIENPAFKKMLEKQVLRSEKRKGAIEKSITEIGDFSDEEYENEIEDEISFDRKAPDNKARNTVASEFLQKSNDRKK